MNEEMRKKKLTSLSKKMKKRMYFSILLALFTLGVNIFAWFAFSANVGLTLDATVASWDVDFRDENDVVYRNVVIEVTKMKPGMTDHVTHVYVNNFSDVAADFSYEVTSFSVLGTLVSLNNKPDVFTYLSDFYPFSISFAQDKATLSANDTIDFTTTVSWPFEEIDAYYAQDEVYAYDSGFTYFTKSGSVYSEFSVANATAFRNNINNLYLEKDDADTYFGSRCQTYEQNSGSACLVLNMKLLVTQASQ